MPEGHPRTTAVHQAYEASPHPDSRRGVEEKGVKKNVRVLSENLERLEKKESTRARGYTPGSTRKKAELLRLSPQLWATAPCSR